MKHLLKFFLIVLTVFVWNANYAQTVVTPNACATETFTVSEGDIITDPTDGVTGGQGGVCSGTDSGDPGDYPNAGCVTTTTISASGPITFTFTTFGIFSTFDWIVITDVATGNVLYDNSSAGADSGDQFLTDLATTSFTSTGNDLLIEFNATTVVSSCGFEATISTCTDPSLIDPNCICPGIFMPVIGCDCVQYNNQCESVCIGGATQFAGPGSTIPWNIGDPCPFPLAPSSDGCTDATACNFDPNATNDDGSCLVVNDPCDDGDPNTINDVIDPGCNCAGVLAINGCTDVNACNFDPTAMLDDGSCQLPGDPCDDGDPNTTGDIIDANCVCAGTASQLNFVHSNICNCAAGIDLDGDGINDLAQETFTVTPIVGGGPYDMLVINLFDSNGVAYTNASLNSLVNGLATTDGSPFSFTVYSQADGTTQADLILSDLSIPQSISLIGLGPCTPCSDNPIPTASEWGLLCLAFGLFITITLFIRKEEQKLVPRRA